MVRTYGVASTFDCALGHSYDRARPIGHRFAPTADRRTAKSGVDKFPLDTLGAKAPGETIDDIDGLATTGDDWKPCVEIADQQLSFDRLALIREV